MILIVFFSRKFRVFELSDDSINTFLNASSVKEKNEIFERSEKVLLEEKKLFSFENDNMNIVDNKIDFGIPINNKYLFIEVIDENNKELKFDYIEADFYVEKIVFRSDKSNEYFLLFGNSKSEKPKYEIEDFKKYINEGDLKEITVGDYIFNNVKNRNKEGKIELFGIKNFESIFNVIVVLFSFILLIFIIFYLIKMKKENR